MRLVNTKELDTGNFEIKEFADDEIPQYAILSHTWEEEEVTFQDMKGTSAANKKGYEKIRQCCSVARASGFEYVWIDTCCIDKTSSAELSEAINSMYRWYEEAEVCYAYLSDVPSRKRFEDSRWFSRGWTLQELIAPSTIIFLDETWKELGTKTNHRQSISNCTSIPVSILSGDNDLEAFSIAQRMSWAAERKTSRIEDRAYCLMGIFGINMPLIYGEKETAFIRLQEEIMRISDDHSLFAWKSPDNRGGLLATSPAAFHGCHNIVQFNPPNIFNSPLTVSSRGISLELRFIGIGCRGLGLAILHCKEGDGEDKLITIYLRDLFLTMELFERVCTEEFKLLDLRKFRPSQYPMRRICIQAGRMTRMRKLKDLGKADNTAPVEIYSDGTLIKLMNFEDPAALLRAVERGLEDIVWLLLTRGDVEASLKGENGRTVLSHAIRGGYEVVVKMLLSRSIFEADLEDKEGWTPLCLAAQIGHDAIFKLLLIKNGGATEAKDKNCRTPLSWAAEKGNEAITQLLLENGAATEAKDKNGRTPLSWAAEKGNKAITQLLLENGAATEAKGKNGQTPLSWAAEKGNKAIVQLLLENGAATEVKDKYGQTPLLWATIRGNVAIVQLLLEKGATTEVKDKNGRTPLSWAAEEGNKAITQLLHENGAVTEAKDKNGWTPVPRRSFLNRHFFKSR